jgi:adenine-specific DNA-methyltransferase
MIDLRLGDCLEILPTIPSGSVSAVVTDPPYAEEYWPILAAAAPQMARVLRDGGETICLVGQHQLPFALKTFAETGLRYWWTCGMQHNTMGRILGKYVVTTWKPALWFVKGKKRRLHDMPRDMVMGRKPGKREHEWEQDLQWFLHWCDRITDPGETILDPFAGTGTTLVACQKTGRDGIGIEIDPKYVEVARRRIKAAETPLLTTIKDPTPCDPRPALLFS